MTKKMTKKELIAKFPFMRIDNKIQVYKEDDYRVRVRKINNELLQITPSEYYWNGSLGISDRGTEVLIITDKVIKVGCKGISGSNSADIPRCEWDGETVLECISKNGINPIEILAIFVSEWEIDDWAGQEYVEFFKASIYFPPKNVSLLLNALKEYQEGGEKHGSKNRGVPTETP